MNPISIGTNTHATHHAEGAHHGHGAKAHGSHGKKGSPFESSLEGALADDDASKLEGETEDDKKKAALGAAPPAQTPQDIAAALAFAAQAKAGEAQDAPTDGDAKMDAKIDEKTAGNAVGALDPKLVAVADDAQASALKALAPTKTLTATPELSDDAKAKAANAKTEPTDAAMTPPVAPATVPAVTPPVAPAPAPAVSAEALAKLHAVKLPEPAKSSSQKTESLDRTATSKSTSTTTEASTSAPAKVLEADGAKAQSDAKDAPGGDSGTGDRRDDKPARMTLAQADKKAKIERAKSDDMSVDAQRAAAKVTDPAPITVPVGLPTETAKTVTPAPANDVDASKAAEITISRADGVSAKTDDAIRAAEAAGHKRTLASGEASGQITTPELGRIEVVAHTIGGANEAGRVEVHVRAVEEHAKQVIAANAESLREHVRVEVPNATVHVQKPQNDLLGNGTSGRDLSDRTAANTSGDGGRGGRGDAPASRESTVKNPAVPGKGARVRFVL